jgi:endonuclease YncB( thermonuclease family)
VAVLDGDTFTLLTASKAQMRIRIHGIDCPEKNQPFGQVAKQFASDAIFGKEVVVDSTDTDRYGRIIGIVYYDEKKMLNVELLKAGLAWHYKKYDNNPQWARWENEARAARRGLWQDPKPVPPWEWRD